MTQAQGTVAAVRASPTSFSLAPGTFRLDDFLACLEAAGCLCVDGLPCLPDMLSTWTSLARDQGLFNGQLKSAAALVEGGSSAAERTWPHQLLVTQEHESEMSHGSTNVRHAFQHLLLLAFITN